MKTLLILAALAALTLSAETPAPAKAEPSSTASTPASKATKAAPQKNQDGTVRVSTTLGELSLAEQSLGKLTGQDNPIPISLKLKRLRAAIKPELIPFEEQRAQLFKKYGVTFVDGKLVVSPEKAQALDAEWKVLSESPVALTVTPVTLSEFGPEVRLSANDLERLEPFLSEEKVKEK